MKVQVSLCAFLRVKRHHRHWQITGECSIAGSCVLLSLGPSVTGPRLAGRQEEARGVTPPVDDDHTRAPAKQTAGPVLLLWSLWILLPHSRAQEQWYCSFHTDSSCGAEGDFPTWIQLCVHIFPSFWPWRSVDCSKSLLRLIWKLVGGGGLFWLNVNKFIATNATHRCSVSGMSQCRALQRHNWSDMQAEREREGTVITFHAAPKTSSSLLFLVSTFPAGRKKIWSCRRRVSRVHPLQSRPGSALVVTWGKKQTRSPITARQSSICQASDRNIAKPNIWLLHKSHHLTQTILSCVSN